MRVSTLRCCGRWWHRSGGCDEHEPSDEHDCSRQRRAHSVKLDDGRIVKFHHLPSGTLKGNMSLVLGPGAVINPESLLTEIANAGLGVDRLSIDPQAMIINKRDIMTESGRGGLGERISSTGQGVGAATARKIMGRGVETTRLAKDIRQLRPFIRETCECLDIAFREDRKVFLEGTQGTGLSIHHGLYPHVTSRDTTVAGCLAEVGVSPSRVRKVVMVCRSYPIRVANPKERGFTSGPLNEISWAEIARRSGLKAATLRKAERTTTTKRKRRVGEFDWVLLRKASSLNAPTDVALTFVDYFSKANQDAVRFEQLDAETIRFIEEVERIVGAPVSLISTRFDARGVIDRRMW